MMQTIHNIQQLRLAVKDQRRAGLSVGFVPTMGFFHDGHLSLMRRSQQLADYTVVSLFVNPTQFAPHEDLSSYPRDLERDHSLAQKAGVDLLFIPTVEEIYPQGFATTVAVDRLGDRLCGKQRGSSHFDGVTTVVCKLLNCVQADYALFGQKDAQQVAVIKRMVEDLNHPSEIVVCPTLREPDGLAMSSRNSYLNDQQRQQAVALSRGLFSAQKLLAQGVTQSHPLTEAVRQQLTAADLADEYIELVSTTDLKPLERVTDEALLLVAARVGPARLIDNVVLRI